MAKTLRQRFKPFYRNHWLPFFEIALTFFFRAFVLVVARLRPLGPAPNPDSFLIISLAGHLGDTVMLLPGIEALRAAHPGANIEVAIDSAAAPLLRSIDIIDRVHAFPLGPTPPATFWLSVTRAVKVLRLWWPRRSEFRPAIAIVPRWGDDLFRSILFAYLTQAPRRIGFASDVLPGQPPVPSRDALLTQRVGGGSGMHEPAKLLLLLASSGLIPPTTDVAAALRTPVSALVRAARGPDWSELSTRLGLPHGSFAVIAPGATMPRRVYPTESWLRVIDALHARAIPVVLLAGPGDAGIVRSLHQLTASQTVLVAGATTLVESAAILAHAAIFLGSDSGPGHLAGSLGIPSIVLFIAEPGCDPDSPAAPDRVRPAGPRVTCIRPAHCTGLCVGSCTSAEAHCIAGILPETIIQAADELLKTPARSLALDEG